MEQYIKIGFSDITYKSELTQHQFLRLKCVRREISAGFNSPKQLTFTFVP